MSRFFGISVQFFELLQNIPSFEISIWCWIFHWFFFQNISKFLWDFQDFLVSFGITYSWNSPRTPRNRFHIPRSPRNVNLPFLDSSIPRGMKFSEELPSLQGTYWLFGRQKIYLTFSRINCINSYYLQRFSPNNLLVGLGLLIEF